MAITPLISSGILESITRESLKQLLEQELKVPVVEREVERTELYVADEVFICGTSVELQPVGSVDRYQVGDGQIGHVTARLQSLYHRVVRGGHPGYADWCTPVYQGQKTQV